jgi:indole-3-glycerol phosphate synthase
VTGLRRLSHAIAEGGISVLVEVGDADSARAAAAQGAEALVLRAPARLRDATQLPIVLYGAELDEEADAVVIDARRGDADALARIVGRAGERGLECVLKVRHEDDLEQALELFDPEIVLLSAEEAGNGQPELERLLELLPDVPAGKLAIAELPRPSRRDVAELERAGVDAVLVGAGDVGGLVDDPPPDV